jgi:hypothetical protein
MVNESPTKQKGHRHRTHVTVQPLESHRSGTATPSQTAQPQTVDIAPFVFFPEDLTVCLWMCSEPVRTYILKERYYMFIVRWLYTKRSTQTRRKTGNSRRRHNHTCRKAECEVD